MKIYIFSITYNFDSDYIAKKCDTYEEALAMLNDYLKKEIKIISEEFDYTPSVLAWADDDITLVYAEGYSRNSSTIDLNNSKYDKEDCAYYRIFEVDIQLMGE